MAETKGFRESSLNDSGELDAQKAVLRLLVVLFICSICFFFCFFVFLYLCVTSPQKKNLRYKSLNLFENRLLIEGRLGKKISTWQATRTGFVFTTEMFLLQ